MNPDISCRATDIRTVFAIHIAASALFLALQGIDAAAQSRPNVNTQATLPAVTISAKSNKDPVEKSYRKMIRGMDLFEKDRALSPQGELRFKLLPRRHDTSLSNINLEVIGTNEAFAVPIDGDQTFRLPRNDKAFNEDAVVSPNRKAQTMTWRTNIRTPGLPPGTRRLGDLRLECRVGMEAGLLSSASTVAGRMAQALLDTPAYCDRKDPLYLFFADRPIFSVTLVNGARREVLSVDKLYAAASRDPRLAKDLSDCDCEVLVDRTYFLPLGDMSWPNDTLVEFEYMEGP